MSNEDIDRGITPPPPSRRNWPIVLLAIAVFASLAVNGWLAYQTWTLNQTMADFAAQRSAFAAGGGFPGAATLGQGTTGFGRQRSEAATGGAGETAAAQSPGVSTPAVAATETVQQPANPMPGEAGQASDANAGDQPAAAAGGFPGGGRGPRAGNGEQGTFVPGGDGQNPGMQPGARQFPPADGAAAVSGQVPQPAQPEAAADVTVPTLAAEALPVQAQTTTVESAAVTVASIPVVTGVKGARLWDDEGRLIKTYDSGVTLAATGRSATGDWLIVQDAGGPGWVPADQVIAYGAQQLAEATLPASTALAPALEETAASGVAAGTEAPAASAIVESQLATTTVPQLAITATPVPVDSKPVQEVTAAVTITDARLNVRSGPGVNYPIVGKAEPGASYAVAGRTADGAWLQLRLDDASGATGWADAAYLAVEGDISTVPEAAVPPLPQPTSTPTTGPAGASAGPTSVQGQAAASAAAALDGVIVFQERRGGMIDAYYPATGILRSLTNGVDPAVSPDGSTVAFTRDGGETGIYLIDIDGTNERRIFERPSLSSPKWSPEGDWIVFSRYDEYIECYQVAPNQCLLPDIFFDRFPTAKPSLFPLVKEYQHKLSAVDYNGQNFHDIPALDSARAPDWGDTGIVYQSKSGIQRTADGQGIATETVAFDPLNPYYFDPDWQPNGGQIAFQRKGAAQTDIWVVNPDGTGMHALTAPATTLVDQLPSNVAPAYSPDGRHIVFLSNRADDNAAGAWRLWVMDADGNNQRPLAIDIALDYAFDLEQAVSWGG